MSPIFRRHGRRVRSATPPAGVLRRERRALLQFREERLRDLGGLLLEMFRRDRFREDLIRERCEELLEVDDHLAAIDSLLGLSWTIPDQTRCACGAPVMDGAEFCAACGSALTAEATFCSRCGMRTDARAVRQAEPAAEIEQEPAPEQAEQESEQESDSAAPVGELTEG